jgi:hypothetical protein
MKEIMKGAFLVVVLAALAGCAATRPVAVERAADMPAAPTTSAIFFAGGEAEGTRSPGTAATRALSEANSAVTPVGWFEQAEATPTAAPLPTPAETATPAPTPAPPRMITATIYADGLNESWTLEHSRWMTFTEQSRVVHSGEIALRFQPEEDFSTLFFTVRPDAAEVFPYRQVMGVGLWLNTGSRELELDDLALTVVGSNEMTYWVPGDDSVRSDNDPIFSETRLYFLGFNRPFPANEWVYVELWLDDLLYDPVYEYVTGFYIKNDRGVFQPIFVDDVHLILMEEPL